MRQQANTFKTNQKFDQGLSFSVVQRSCWSNEAESCIAGTGSRTVCTCLEDLCNCDNCEAWVNILPNASWVGGMISFLGEIQQSKHLVDPLSKGLANFPENCLCCLSAK